MGICSGKWFKHTAHKPSRLSKLHPKKLIKRSTHFILKRPKKKIYNFMKMLNEEVLSICHTKCFFLALCDCFHQGVLGCCSQGNVVAVKYPAENNLLSADNASLLYPAGSHTHAFRLDSDQYWRACENWMQGWRLKFKNDEFFVKAFLQEFTVESTNSCDCQLRDFTHLSHTNAQRDLGDSNSKQSSIPLALLQSTN